MFEFAAECYCNLQNAFRSSNVEEQIIFYSDGAAKGQKQWSAFSDPCCTHFLLQVEVNCAKRCILSTLNVHPISRAGRWKCVFWFVQMRSHFSVKWGWNILNGQLFAQSVQTRSCTFTKSSRIFSCHVSILGWIHNSNCLYLLQLWHSFQPIVKLAKRNAVEWLRVPTKETASGKFLSSPSWSGSQVRSSVPQICSRFHTFDWLACTAASCKFTPSSLLLFLVQIKFHTFSSHWHLGLTSQRYEPQCM